MATKKTTAVKEETKVTAAAAKTAAVKEEAKTETKPAAKAPAKKTTKKAVETKVSVTLQYAEKNTTVESVVEAAKAAYKAEGNTDEIKTLEVYLQPENNVAYYVINGNAEGKSVNL